MLRSLHIQNYALIDELVAEFPSGLAIITGETGAGKSIIIESLNLLLGERASSDDVRKGAAKAVVEGIFSVERNAALKALHQREGIDWNNELILRREVSAQGQSRCFANDSPITLSVLKSIGNALVDLHGQHEHQSLLRRVTHIVMLDEYGGLGREADEYKENYRTLQALIAKRAALTNRAAVLNEKRDLYEFQLREIDELDPRAGEVELLEQECKVLENAEQLLETTGKLYALVTSGEQSVRDLLLSLRAELDRLAHIDPAFTEALNETSAATAIVDELGKFLLSYHERITFEPSRLEQLRDRLLRLSRLKRKYGGTLETLLEHRSNISREITGSETLDVGLDRLTKEIDRVSSLCMTLATRLSLSRKKVAKPLERKIVTELGSLGIPNVQFHISFTPASSPGENRALVSVPPAEDQPGALNEHGIDEVEFLISTNRGEELQPLVRIASGGEVSRIMLALKNVLVKTMSAPVMVFDEIDVGVSGRIAQQVGRSLKSLSKGHQVIAITHLPQIAGLGDAHFVVSKHEAGGRTRTTMTRLSLDERIREVAKLMSGESVTSAGLAGAKELMGLSKQ